MGKVKALIIRLGAYGDIIHASHLPRLLKDQGFDVVDWQTNFKGYQLLGHNPFIDNILFFEPSGAEYEWLVGKNWQILGTKYDKVINLYKTLEYNVSVMEDQNEYYMPKQVRENRYGNVNYYDIATIEAGYPELCGCYMGEIFYPQAEIDIVEKWMKQFEGKWVAMINLCGTGPHKEVNDAQKIADYILNKYPNAHIITTGGPEYKKMDLSGERITSIVGKFPFRQALLIARYIDLMVTGESGIGVGAAMWGTPTIQLLTAANRVNHCNYAKNDLSLQSEAYCSPCYKGPYKYIGCPNKGGKPLCIYFDLEKIFNKIDEGYGLYKAGYTRRYPNSSDVPSLRDVACSGC